MNLPPDHPAFGPCITVRRKGIPDWIIYSILMLLLASLGLGMTIGGVVSAVGGDWIMLLLSLGGLVLLSICWLIIRTLVRVVEFYHEGAVERIFKRRRGFPYEGATELTYSLVRQYHNGIYGGTALAIALKVADGRVLKYNGRHKEKPKGLAFTVFGKEFKGEDELDVVRDVTASCVAASLAAKLAAEGSVAWASAATLSAVGITPKSGKLKGTLVPWTDIGNVGTGAGSFGLFMDNEQKAFVSFAVNSKNFYPGLELFRTLASGVPASQSPTEPANGSSLGV